MHPQAASFGGRLSRRDFLAASAGLATIPAWAQGGAWPTTSLVKMITPAPVASSVDVIARIVSERLAKKYGRPFPVENRPGAEGIVAAENFVQQAPGSALFFSGTGVYTSVHLIYDKLPYNPEVDIVPITAPATDFLAYVCAPNLPAKTLAELVQLVRSRPGKLNYATAPGTFILVNGFVRESKLDIQYINYRRFTDLLPDIAAGRVEFACVPLAPTLPLIRAGQIRLLAVTNDVRAPATPEVPTAREAGFPQLELEGYPTLFGWKGMPASLRESLAADLVAMSSEPDIQKKFEAAGLASRGAGIQKLTTDLVATRARWTRLAQAYGARPPE